MPHGNLLGTKIGNAPAMKGATPRGGFRGWRSAGLTRFACRSAVSLCRFILSPCFLLPLDFAVSGMAPVLTNYLSLPWSSSPSRVLLKPLYCKTCSIGGLALLYRKVWLFASTIEWGGGMSVWRTGCTHHSEMGRRKNTGKLLNRQTSLLALLLSVVAQCSPGGG